MNKRIHDLLASGAAKTEDEAKQMAAAEFAKHYPYVDTAQQRRPAVDLPSPYSLLKSNSSISKMSVARRGMRGGSPRVP